MVAERDGAAKPPPLSRHPPGTPPPNPKGAEFWRVISAAGDADDPSKVVVRAASFVQAVERGRQVRKKRRAGHHRADTGAERQAVPGSSRRRHRKHREGGRSPASPTSASGERHHERHRSPSVERERLPGSRRRRCCKSGEGGHRSGHSYRAGSQDPPTSPSAHHEGRREGHGERHGDLRKLPSGKRANGPSGMANSMPSCTGSVPELQGGTDGGERRATRPGGHDQLQPVRQTSAADFYTNGTPPEQPEKPEKPADRRRRRRGTHTKKAVDVQREYM